MDSHYSSEDHSQDAGFFERERNRLIGDISKGVESILGNTNSLNRKIEESISVGKEFHPISELWSKFERIMTTSGIPNLYPSAPTTNDTSAGEGAEKDFATPKKKLQKEEEGDGDGLKFELEGGNRLPPGVAPGGGRIYA
ncbi:DASH complex subunit DAD1 [Pseudozyma hubeiensis]|nr:DASH complex subunit DAD1 [Pseudozyma hubeiensis]